MPTLTLTVGLPGCGKSTWAKEQVKLAKSKTVILNLDDLRSTMVGGNIHDYSFSKSSEKYVLAQQHAAAASAVLNGWNIIVADTNMNPLVFNSWKQYAKDNGYTFKEQNFFDEFRKGKSFVHEYFAINAYVKQCKTRNIQRHGTVLEEVIDRFANKYMYSTIKFPEIEMSDGFRYIIVDIDGTIAHMGDKRSPYDESKVDQDDPDWTVMNTIHAEYEYDTKRTRIIVMSGRHETCREMTEAWLQEHAFPYHYLFMRGADDNRGDDVVKYELYMKHVHGTGKRVSKVFDDRDRVVDMWRKCLGLKVYQVAYGAF